NHFHQSTAYHPLHYYHNSKLYAIPPFNLSFLTYKLNPKPRNRTKKISIIKIPMVHQIPQFSFPTRVIVGTEKTASITIIPYRNDFKLLFNIPLTSFIF